MRMKIRSRGLRLNDEMRGYIESTLRYALGWFSRRIGEVAVYVAERKTPYGDLRCRIVVNVPRASRIVVSEENPQFHALIDRAAQRVSQAVQRHFERRTARRLRHSRRRIAAVAA